MFIKELIRKRAYCPTCGKQVPSTLRLGISFVSNTIMCPHCRSWLTLDRSILVLNLLIILLILPTLALTFPRHHYLLGIAALLILAAISVVATFIAKYQVVTLRGKSGAGKI